MKCQFAGCKDEVRWLCRKLWGKGGTLLTCDGHKPDASKRPEKLRNLPFFYEVSAIARGSDR